MDSHTKCSRYENYRDETQKTYYVQQIELDSLGYFEDVAFIKVDIEGLELEFFRGARKTIVENNFPPIIFELWDLDWYKEKADQTRSYLEELGYSFMPLGMEILAQHPAHYRTMKFVLEGDTMETRLVQNSE